MKNINRDYLVKVDARTAKITPSPKDLKFFMTDVLTSNIFFLLEFKDYNESNITDLINDKALQSADNYDLILRVVKPNNEPKTIKADQLHQGKNFFVADLTTDFVNMPGIYECELFIETQIEGKDGILRKERSTTDSFEYEVKESIFYDLDDIVDKKYLSIEDIATVAYVNQLALGGVTLEGYATDRDLDTKADKGHIHNDYITQNQLDEALAEVDVLKINLDDFVASNSISIKRKENSVIGEYSTAEGYDTVAIGKGSHAEGSNTKASSYSSHAEGSYSVAHQDSAHAEGYNTKAGGYASHSEGYFTKAIGDYQHVQGKYNVADETYAHIVGKGTDEENRSNAHTLDWDGNAWFAGDVYVGADNKKLATEAYVNSVAINGAPSGGGSIDNTEIMNILNNKADKDHTHDEYATVEYIDGKLWVGTQAEYDAIETKNDNVIYFIEED